MIHIILLSGGSGTRLWPLSNNARSKQFLKVLRDREGKPVSMVQRVFSQLEAVPVELDVTIATGASQAASIEMQVQGDYRFVIEPERRDTAPAIMLACAHLAMEQEAKPDDTVVVMPIDTFTDQAYYDRIAKLDEAVQEGSTDLVLLGVEPTYPSAKYGYIIPGELIGEIGVLRVESFKEKPDEETAQRIIEKGGLWNCGVFAFRLKYLSKITKSYCSADSFSELEARFRELPKNSFDYEVVEKAHSISALSYSGIWKDLGTWNTLSEEMADTSSGRVLMDDESCRNVHVINETGLPMVVAGIDNAVVVATPDGLLVSGKEKSANIKQLIESIGETRPMYEQRRWGEYRVLDYSAYSDGTKSLVKELVVKAGKQLSYQRHTERTEIWTISTGFGKVVIDGKEAEVSSGTVVNIQPGERHSVIAIEELHIIEVQLGDMLEEDDIERFGEYWR